MSRSSQKLRAVLDDFSQQDRIPPDVARHMQDAISSSPFLTAFMATAAEKGLVENIRFSPPETKSAGHYEATGKTIYLNSEIFEDFQRKKISADELHDRIVATLGHETSHAFGAEVYRGATYKLDSLIENEIRGAGPGGQADLTEAVREYLDAARSSEAKAERAGWNALASRVVTQNGGTVVTDDLLKRSALTTHCVVGDKDKPKELAPGITLDAKGQRPSTLNEAVARCHFDDSGETLGRSGNANYRNYYASYTIERIEKISREFGSNPREIQLNMISLQLDGDQIAGAGLDFGNEGRRLHVTDPVRGFVSFAHNTSKSSRTVPDAHVADEHVERTDLLTSGFSDPTHRDHVLYRTVQQSVQTQLPAGAEISEDRLAQFTLAAKAAHFKPGGRIDALISETGVSFRGDYPAHSTRIDLADPVPPADESAQKAANMDREQARQSEQLASRPNPELEQAPVMQH